METYKVKYKYTFWNKNRDCEWWAGVGCLVVAESAERAKEIFIQKLKSIISVPFTEQISTVTYYCSGKYHTKESISSWEWLPCLNFTGTDFVETRS
jgi:hypothetical protein